jgi:hypothetical protein
MIELTEQDMVEIERLDTMICNNMVTLKDVYLAGMTAMFKRNETHIAELMREREAHLSGGFICRLR